MVGSETSKAAGLVQATFVKEGWMVLLVANVHTELHVEAAKFDLKRKF